MLTPERIAEIERRHRNATAGPWVYSPAENPLNELGRKAGFREGMSREDWIVTEWNHGQLGGPMSIVCIGVSPYFEKGHVLRMEAADGDFIAHAREDIPDLIAALKAARERESELRDALEDMVICAASMDWNNAEIINALAALAAGDAEGTQQVPRKGN